MKKVTFVFIFAFVILAGYIGYTRVEHRNQAMSYEAWEKECLKEYEAANDYYIFVDIPKNKLTLFKSGEIVKEYSVSTGKATTPSPVGVFRIVSKSDWGEGFGGRWMGFNVPWGKYGIHGTLEPGSIGWDSSHGCIRMNNKDVKELYSIVKIGTKVEIYGGDIGPLGDRMRVLEPGDRGADVMEVQKRMKLKGYYYGNPDGIYGSGMETMVVKFQKDHKLKTDKKIGAQMYKLLGIVPMD